MRLIHTEFVKTISLIIVALFLTGCASLNPFGSSDDKTTPLTISHDSNGNPMQTSVRVNQTQAVEVLTVNAAEASRSDYFMMKKAMYEQTDPNNMAMVRAVELLGNDRSPNGYFDYRMAVEGEKTKRWGFARDVGLGILPYALAGRGSSGGGTKYVTNVDNGSSYRGCQGKQCSTTYTEQTAPYGGIPLLPGEVLPIGLTGETPTEEEVQAQEGGATCPDGFFPRPDDPSVCSDGMGGTADPI